MRLSADKTRVLTALIMGLAFSVPGAMAKARPLPELSLKDLAGNKHKLSEYRGRVVVLNFWATWCGPCQHEFPMLSRVAKDYAEKNVAFIAVSIDEKENILKIQPFLEQHGIQNIQVWAGGDESLLERYKLGIMVPATIVVAEDGSALTRILGEAREQEIRDRIEWLLGGGKGPAPEAVVRHTE